MVRGATMAANSVNDRNDADLAIGYRAALRRAAAAAREAAVLEDLLAARGAAGVAGDGTLGGEARGRGRVRLQMMRSPSQWPPSVLPSTVLGRSWMETRFLMVSCEGLDRRGRRRL